MDFLDRHLLYVSIPALGVSVLVLAGLILQVREMLAAADLLRVPLGPDQEVRFDGAGDVILHGEGPLLTTRFRGLTFSLAEMSTGEVLRGRPIFFRTSSSTFSKVRLSLRRFTLARPGAYTLRVAGLRPGVDYASCGILFARPQGFPMVLRVLGIVLSSLTLVASLVLSILFIVTGNAGFESVETHRGAQRAGAPVGVAPERLAQGGRALPIDRAIAASWSERKWPAVGMRFRVPGTWRERRMSDGDLDFREGDEPSPYLAATATAFPDFPAQALLDANVDKAKGELERREITGYAVKRLGQATGVVTLEMRHGDDMRMIVWTGFVGPAGGLRSVTLLLGAENDDYDRLEPALGAILDSVRFE